MGDTFPTSLKALDDRAGKSKNPTLQSFTQEKGRLCRYTINDDSLPYMYVNDKLYNKLSKSIRNECGYFTSFLENNPLLDYKTTNEEDGQTGVKIRHADSTNPKKKRQNHFLLTAEPQCGKTGCYLSLIALIRQEIGEEFEVDNDSDIDFSESEEMEEGSNFTLDGQNDPFVSVIPHWKVTDNLEKLPRVIETDSKYRRFTGSYR